MPDETLVQEDEEQELFELSDIEVSTLGLVASGMVGETFFLLKSEDGMAANELEILEEALAGSQEEQKVKKGPGSILERIGVSRLTELIRKGMKFEGEIKEALSSTGTPTEAAQTAMDELGMKAEERVEKGASLAALLNRRIDALESDDRSRSEIVQDMAKEGGIKPGTVNQILNASIGCPPEDSVLPGLARALNLRLESLIEAGNRDDCGYGNEEMAKQEDDPVNKSAGESDEVNKMADVDKQEVVEEAVEQESPVTEGVQKGTEVAQGDGGQAAQMAELAKANKDILARLAKSDQQAVEAQKEAAEAQVRIAKAEAVAMSERDLRERMAFVEKAEKDYLVIPVKADDLGEFLHYLSKSDAEVNIEKAADAEDRVDRLGFVSGIFEAVNEMVLKSGIFKEQGSAKIPEDMTLVEKAEALAKEKNISFRDAVVNLNDVENAEMKDYLLNN